MARDPSPGLIFEIARIAEIELNRSSGKAVLCCPFHDDHTPSAVLFEDNVFYCSVCTPGKGWGLRRFARELGVDVPLRTAGRGRGQRRTRQLVPQNTQRLDEAGALWTAALRRAREDDSVDADRCAYDYLARRQLMPAWEEGLVGVLGTGLELPEWGLSWVRSGYALVTPMFGADGAFANVQARAIVDRSPKVMTPEGLTTKGVAFANKTGRALLRGEPCGECSVVVCEGLTDFLAIGAELSTPVLGAAGSSVVASIIGRWACERSVVLALDHDEAGDAAVPSVLDALREFGARDAFRLEWPGAAKDACCALERIGPMAFASLLRETAVGGASCPQPRPVN